MMTDAPWLDAAWAEFGVREKPGSANERQVVAYFAEAGSPEILNDSTAWCAAFVGAMLARGRCAGTQSLLARSYLNWGVAQDQPKPGAIAVLTRGREAWQGHVGFYLGRDDKRVFLLGGNQNNAVNVAAFDVKRVIGYRWPDEAEQATAQQSMTVTATPDTFFDIALDHVLRMEGGYSDDPHDPGGPTNQGVTLAVFAAWRGVSLQISNCEHLIADLKAIKDADVRSIYRSRYWGPAGCAEMPLPLALMHFDCAVNQGVGTAIRILQSEVGTAVDGEIGPNTRAALARHTTHARLAGLIERYAQTRRDRYRKLSTFWRFGKGWLRRVDATLDAATQLIAPERSRGVVGRDFMQQQEERKMKEIEYDRDGPNAGKWWGHSKTIWGTLITVVSTVLPTIGPLIGVEIPPDLIKEVGEKTVQAVQVLGGLIGTLLAIYGRIHANGPVTRRQLSLKL